MPKLFRFLSLHLALGCAVGVIVASGIVTFNIAGIKDLLEGDSEPYVALFLLYAFNMLTYGSLAMGIGVMTLPLDEVPESERKRHEEDPPLS